MTTICEIRKMGPNSDFWQRDSQKVVESFVIGDEEAYKYAKLLTDASGVRHVVWVVGFVDEYGRACTMDKHGRIIPIRRAGE